MNDIMLAALSKLTYLFTCLTGLFYMAGTMKLGFRRTLFGLAPICAWVAPYIAMYWVALALGLSGDDEPTTVLLLALLFVQALGFALLWPLMSPMAAEIGAALREIKQRITGRKKEG